VSYDRDKLRRLMMAKRESAGQLSARAAAKEVGLARATYSRIENGEPANGDSLFAVLRWLGVPLDHLGVPDEVAGTQQPLINEPAEVTGTSSIEAHLRARQHLDPNTAAALAEALRRVADMLDPGQEA
jgi:transcriptional regulator with XRE-family HTH domain